MEATGPNWGRLAWISGVNGYSIAVSCALLTLISLAMGPPGAGFLAGSAVTGAAVLEILGSRQIRARQADGLTRAATSQVGVFAAIASYCLYQWWVLTPESILTLLSPSTKDFLKVLYGLDDELLAELLLLTGKVTYVVLFLVSFLYQGSLYWFYRRCYRKALKDSGGSPTT